ncbi:MAG: methyltransferase domain-containing protein [Rhizomicrobium sp.]|jgi:phosphatidylethanolamine/phosphatidyl-N-methylethanolamine N-methyltransferase
MPLSDQARFLRRLAANPTHIGAVAPSSARLARAMAAEADPSREGPVLELGPGTGVVTQALIARGFKPERITAIEVDAHFAQTMRARFPAITVVQGDAFQLADVGARFAAIVSSLPLLNFPLARRQTLIADALSRLAPGAPYIQFSYGFTPPVAAPDGACVKLAARVWLNLPPARVWVYRA